MKKQNWQRGDKAPGDDTGVKNSREPHRKVFRTRANTKKSGANLKTGIIR